MAGAAEEVILRAGALPGRKLFLLLGVPQCPTIPSWIGGDPSAGLLACAARLRNRCLFFLVVRLREKTGTGERNRWAP